MALFLIMQFDPVQFPAHTSTCPYLYCPLFDMSLQYLDGGVVVRLLYWRVCGGGGAGNCSLPLQTTLPSWRVFDSPPEPFLECWNFVRLNLLRRN